MVYKTMMSPSLLFSQPHCFFLDNCPWGDQKGVAAHGLTCNEFGQPEHTWRCYEDFTAKVCCATCNAAYTNRSGMSFSTHLAKNSN